MPAAPDDPWSAVADDWGRYWGTFARPVWAPLLDAAGIGPGSRVLDVGCGSGELLEHLQDQGARPAGVDPATRMVELARARAVGADVRVGEAEHLPFDDGAFDAVLAVNAVQFADDVDDALAEISRVLTPDGVVGLAGWADRTRNDLDAINVALAEADDEEPPEDGPLRLPGGLAAVLAEAGWAVLDDGVVPVPWTARDANDLVRGILFGEGDTTVAELAPVVVESAAPFRRPDGSYRLLNAFRWAVARRPRSA
ncbi:class I SAM-dependent methyltransferase [Promicromonospora sp. NPDC059942]|uniref:class I SAM-dependent methyltransferase n=1 Tax=Promicromonospora sp. NPDC059942 TaxID=3347009 RepID=UPI0036538C43